MNDMNIDIIYAYTDYDYYLYITILQYYTYNIHIPTPWGRTPERAKSAPGYVVYDYDGHYDRYMNVCMCRITHGYKPRERV